LAIERRVFPDRITTAGGSHFGLEVVVLVRFVLFLSSFSPLFAMLALRFTAPALRLGAAGLCLVGLVGALFVLAAEGRKGAASFEVKNVEDSGPEVAGYLASYILPFVAIDQPAPELAVAYMIFLLVAAVVYVQSDMVQINPVFYLLGRRVEKITTAPDDWQAYLITRRRALVKETIQATTLSQGVLVRLKEGRR
jgi:hypothetical protein